jgi:hypothetical protein
MCARQTFYLPEALREAREMLKIFSPNPNNDSPAVDAL